MRLYLVQHGDAVAKAENPDRPLSEKGRADVGKVASFLARSCRGVPRILHSGKTRAALTAAALADVLHPGLLTETGQALAPDDDPGRLAEAAAGWDEDTMVVGHQPFMGRAVSHLVTGNPDVAKPRFTPGTVACLERDEKGGWALTWMVSPDLFG